MLLSFEYSFCKLFHSQDQQKSCKPGTSAFKALIPWFTLYTTNPSLKTLRKRPCKNTVGKGEKAGKQHFLFSPQ